MRLATQLLALPTSILLLITSHTFARAPEHDAVSPPWPYNLPPHVMYWPEDPPDRRRGLEVVEEHFRLGRTPVGVMKMSEDEGEKFYMEYWRFEGELGEGQTPLGISEGDTSGLRRRDVEEEEALAANASAILRFRPPFMLHGEGSSSGSAELRFRDSKRALAALSKRDFTCPTGTSDCSSIGYEGSCCTTGEVCFEIEDTGLGPVGCCPAGATCGGTITNCDAPNTACSAELGGGCCIPDYACVVGGCAIDPSLVVTTIITQIFSVTSTSSSSTTTICPQSCAASLGGGCCPTDRVCALSSCAPLPASSTTTVVSTALFTTTATGSPPVRPTSGSGTASSTATSTTTSTSSTITSDIGPTACPTGFYACSAYYEGGCCRTGRNCEKTSCPASSSTTIISSGVTIVVPVGSAAVVVTPTGTCASGWSTCAASVGGNCCPSGWACGTASCSSVNPTSTAVAQKESPGKGHRNGVGMGLMVAAGCFVLGMMMI